MIPVRSATLWAVNHSLVARRARKFANVDSSKILPQTQPIVISKLSYHNCTMA
jgi:hypothetical protein